MVVAIYQGVQFCNKKSAESGVAPAGIKSYKFLFELKKKSILQ